MTHAPSPSWDLPDFNTYPVQHRAVRAETIGHGIAVTWDDGLRTEHHRFVLRENSPDPATTHPLSREQQLQLTEIPPDLEIVGAEVDADGGVRVQWSTGPVAESVYHPGWLRAWAAETTPPNPLPDQVVWDATLDLATVSFDGDAVLAGGDEFDRFLLAVHTHGVALVRGLPVDEDMIERLPSMLGPVRTTNFGHVFDVRTKSAEVTSNAYTDLELPVHTDLDTREYMPGLQFLWCMVNDATGGESRLSDAAAITRHLRSEHPEAYDALTTIPVSFINKATDTDYRFVAPFLVVDDAGELVEARWSPWLRGPLQASIADAERFYAGLRLALQLGDDARFVVSHKLGAGDMLAFDNRRVLHGRGPLDRSTGERWLRGSYVEREELESRLRVRQR